jgi:hypothetical protein
MQGINHVHLNLEALEDRMVPSSMAKLPALPNGTPGLMMPAPGNLPPPPPMTSANQLFSGQWLGPLPSGQPPANLTAMADQIFAEMAVLFGPPGVPLGLRSS